MLPPIKGSIHEILNGQKQFIIPVYQRTYSWEIEQCKRLWEDIVEMQKENKYKHFMGSMVNVAEAFSPTGINQYTIIDGQQRTTTLVILLIALRDFIINNKEIKTQIKPATITDIYLKNIHQEDEEQYKLILTQGDRDNLINLIEGFTNKIDENSRLLKNYQFFYSSISDNRLSPSEVYESLSKLEIVNITLERDKDNPQQIFESLNSTGIDLSQSDLIRNYVLMGLAPNIQNKMYKHYWYPMEKFFNYEKQSFVMDDFFKDYITTVQGKIPTKPMVYEEFKKCHPNINEELVKKICQNLYSLAELYTTMYYANEKNTKINLAFIDIKSLKMNVAYPFLLQVYRDYKNELINEEEFIEILRLCESYVFRRSVCSIPTNSLNKTFATMYSQIDKDNYNSSFKYILNNLMTYKTFPNDEMLYKDFIIKDMYNTRLRVYILNKLENYNNKAAIISENFTIEHIMPQNKNLNNQWKKDLGEDWKLIQKRYINTIGNLTLTAYNSEMSDKPFLEKMEIKGGFKENALRLNSYLIKQETWNEDKIKERAEILYNQAINVWKFPYISEDEIDMFSKKDSEGIQEYSIKDYMFSDESKSIYELLDRNIIDKFPDVTREYKKYYIAYKYETNFVDIIPQSKALKLIINMKFEEIDDPKKMGIDQTNIGTWGNGDMEIKLMDKKDINYVLGIIEQSYNSQLKIDE